MGTIPRELFVPKQLRGVAYGDEDLDLGQGSFLVEPLVLARLIQTAEIKPDEVALVIGDATGYAAAVAARLAATVILLVPPGTATAPIEQRLSGLGCDNAVLEEKPLVEGDPAQAPFDVDHARRRRAQRAACLDRAAGRWRPADGGRAHGNSGKVTVHRKLHGAVARSTPYDARRPDSAGLRAG